MDTVTPEEQVDGRYKLMSSAEMANIRGYSMREWMESPVVLECCKKYELDEDVLEHIAWLVWYPMKR